MSDNDKFEVSADWSDNAQINQDKYNEWYEQSFNNNEDFWNEHGKRIEWMKPYTKVKDVSFNRDNFSIKWYEDGTLNASANCIDRHLKDKGDQTAIIWEGDDPKDSKHISYNELHKEVSKLANGMKSLGIKKGDRVTIYMPMIPEAAYAMLACTRIGAIHSVVFGGFAAAELAKRVDDATPKVIISASCGHEPGRIVEYKPLLDSAIDLATHKPSKCVIVQREAVQATLINGRDIEWHAAHEGAVELAPISVHSTDPLYILYTSGTTGQPKGVVRDNGGHAVALNWSMQHIYDVSPGDVYWAASDIGWVVGHSYITYAPLIYGCTSILFEGKPIGTPDAGVFWRVIAEHKVKVLFTAPTAFRAIKRADPDGKFLQAHDTSCLKYLFLQMRSHIFQYLLESQNTQKKRSTGWF